MIGGSHTAGYMDDALYYDGQQYSIANLLSNQLQKVGSGAFYQPYMPANSVGVSGSGMSRFKLGYKTDCLGVTALSPVRLASSGDVAALNTNVYDASQPFGNYGVPGMTVSVINVPGYGLFNPFYARMSSSGTANVLDDALQRNIYQSGDFQCRLRTTGGFHDRKRQEGCVVLNSGCDRNALFYDHSLERVEPDTGQGYSIEYHL
jgi:hypothetical protein